MQRLYIHPIPVRVWHWINAIAFVALILTALQIRYVGLIDVVSFRTAVAVHNDFAAVLTVNFLLWLVYYLFSDRIVAYHAELHPRKYFVGAFRQAYYYSYGIFKGEPNPFKVGVYRKFNPLQSMFYQIVAMLCLPIQIYTGILLWDVTRFQAQVNFIGGVRVVDTIHVLNFIFLVFFLIIHVYLATLGHTRMSHIKAMITGYEDVEDEPERAES